MKTFYYLLVVCFFFGISHAQVGIGTTTPNAQLDITSSNQATPANTDGILVPKIDEFPVTAPTVAQDGMMVFVTGTGTPSRGFYYWNHGGTIWAPFAGTSEWTDAGTYISPSDGVLEDVTIGGANNTTARLTVVSNKAIAGLFTNSGVQNTLMYGVNTSVSNTSTSAVSNTVGNYNDVANIGLGNAYGDFNWVRGASDTNMYGSFNSLTSNANGHHFGVSSVLDGNGNGNHNGVSNLLNGTGDGDQTGVVNDINNTGDGFHNGVLNSLGGSGTNNHTGVQNNLYGTGTGRQRGMYTNITNSSAGEHIGVFNVIRNDGNGDHFGVRNEVIGDGISSFYGTSNYLQGMGAGTKIGSYNLIPSGSGGTHYGVYSDVRKVGSYAGYFFGRVLITSTGSDGYILPAGRGSNGQVMQTDGIGNMSWVFPASFSVDELNDLVDGRSDNDGSNNGSSVYLGIGAGTADDFTDNANAGIGFFSMNANTTGQRNTAVGQMSLRMNTTGSSQVALGHLALNSSNGSGNVAIGANGLGANTSGTFNVAAGYYSLAGNVDGANNVAIGNQALLANTSGDENTAIGEFAMVTNSTGSNNTAIGGGALSLNSTGSNNIAIGYQAGQNTQTVLTNVPNNNIIIGHTIDLQDLSGSNQLSIGNLIYGTGLNGVGQISSSGNIGIGVQAPLDKLDVGGRLRVSTSSSSAAQFRNDDNFNHLSDNNIDFGDPVDAWMVSSMEGTNENSGIYGDRDFVTVWAPADSGRMIRFLDEDAWGDNDGDPYNNSAELAYVDNAGQFVQASDKNRKQNITKIEGALQKLNQINGYTYEYKLSSSEKQKGGVLKKTSGVLAQELYEVLPEAVQISENGEYFVHYAGIIPLLIEGAKEQQKVIDELKTEISQLKRLEERIIKLENN